MRQDQGGVLVACSFLLYAMDPFGILLGSFSEKGGIVSLPLGLARAARDEHPMGRRRQAHQELSNAPSLVEIGRL